MKHELFSEDAKGKVDNNCDLAQALRVQALMSGLQSKTISKKVKGLLEK